MTGRRAGAPLGFVLAVATLAGCGAGGGMVVVSKPFSTEWSDDQGKSIAAVQAHLASSRPTPGADVVVGSNARGDGLIGMPLSGAPRWTFAHALDARPVIAGGVVVASGGGEVFALDALRGKRMWARPTGGLGVFGAGDDGTLTAVTLGSPGASTSVLLAVTRDGTVVRQIESDRALGVPAVVSKVALVPWDNQYVSAIDLPSGDEVGRVVLREKTSHAWTVGGGVYFGEVGIFRFDDKIARAGKGKASHVGLPPRELPGAPSLLQPGGQKHPLAAGATDRIRLLARPSGPEGVLGIDSGQFYATYFRLVLGFDAERAGLSWVFTHPSDILGAQASAGGVVICDDHGKVLALDAKTGAVRANYDLGEPLQSCVVGVDGWRPSSGSSPRAETLAAQISRALFDPEPTLATAQRLILRELATVEDDTATKTLLDLASDWRTSPLLVGETRSALARRRNGVRYMLESLQRHYDFLHDVTRPPPVAPLAQALASVGEKSAAPLLAEHLLDPSASDEDVKEAAAALAVLGGASELAALKEFFALYRGTAASDEMVAAVLHAGRGIVNLGGAAGRALVEQATKDHVTTEAIRPGLEEILRPKKTGQEKPAK